MSTLLLVSGSLRSFRENIRILNQFDIAVCVAIDDDDTYLNTENTKFLFEETCIRTLVLERNIYVPPEFKTTQQQNMYKQWYKLWRLWKSIPKTYETYVRIRPDIFFTDIEELKRAIATCTSLSIPSGNERDGINDQLAIGKYIEMKHYCNMVKSLKPTISSELNLAIHLRDKIQIQQVPVQYKLVLSTAKVVAITGDSGSGKTRLSSIIQPLFLFDKVLLFETDRYHKWERGDERWTRITHLNPNANYLEKLEDDTFNLKLGNAIISVDYDHSTGKFTSPQTIEPKENIILCGLHTLYSKRLRDLVDIKIYVDTTDELKTDWKVQRDTKERGYSLENVLKKIESRQQDYKEYIVPQKYHADIVVRFHNTSLTIVSSHKEWLSGIPGEHMANSVTLNDQNVDMRNQIQEYMSYLDLPQIDALPGYDGVLQFTILRALYTKHG